MSGASKVTSMHDAIAEFVHDGDTVAIEGFTHLICFAAGHEIIRQRRRELTLCRLTSDLVYDQMMAAGVARKLVLSWLFSRARVTQTIVLQRSDRVTFVACRARRSLHRSASGSAAQLTAS